MQYGAILVGIDFKPQNFNLLGLQSYGLLPGASFFQLVTAFCFARPGTKLGGREIRKESEKKK